MYNISGEYVRYDSQVTAIIERFKEYETSDDISCGDACIKISCSPELYRLHSNLTREQWELIDSLQIFSSELLKRGKILIHAAAVVIDGNTYLFAGKAGSGKSTISDIITEQLKNRAFILSDDRVVIGKVNSKLVAWKTPWSKRGKGYTDTAYAVNGFIILCKSEVFKIERIHKHYAEEYLLDQYPEKCMARVAAVLHDLMENGRFWKLQNNLTDLDVTELIRTLENR